MFVRKRGRLTFRQSAAIPYRKGEDGCEILLMTSRTNHRWIIPKGLIEPHLSPPASAAEEVYEEAGVRGKICDTCLGTYPVEKWDAHGTVEVYALKVTEELDDWPEKDDRERQWLPIKQAIETAGDEGVVEVLRTFQKRKKKKNGG